MVYRKLKRTWSHNDLNYIPRLREVFPELSKIDSEELADRFHELKLDFYYEEQKPVKWFVRITLPFGLTLMLLMLIALPLKFIITGTWQYSLGKNNRILNWFKALKLQ
jgi:hypothetical protein